MMEVVEMAKYDITYSCGHTGTVQLYGPGKERDRKIEWYETQADCPDCYKAKKRAEEASKPIEMQITTNGLDKDQDGNIIAEIILTGGTINRKDDIKAMGYHWAEVRGGVFDMLSTSRPKSAWIKVIPIIKIGKSPEWDAIATEAKTLGAEIKIKIDPISMEMAARSTKAKQDADDRIAQLVRPERPASHPRSQHPDGRWNGKYYGKAGSRSYYVDNVQYSLTDTEYDECMAYRAAFDAYKSECDKIRKEVQA